MNKFAACLIATFTALLCSAAGFSFCIGSAGIDRYADGTPVLPGERYGLVLVPAGKTFYGVRSDGTLVNPAANILYPIAITANAQHCLPVCSYTLKDSCARGTAYLVLFDTRTPTGGVDGPVTNGWGLAALSVAIPSGQESSASATRTIAPVYATASDGASVRVSNSATLPASVPASAVIEKMDFVGDEVRLTVRDTGAAAYYAVAGAEDLTGSAFKTTGTASAVRGADNAGETITVTYPKNAKARFFKIRGGTLMDL